MASTLREQGESEANATDAEKRRKSTSSDVASEKSKSENMPGLILPSGEINWDCPCLDGMATGPCGAEFRAAFSCFHFSREENKGSDCLPQLRAMQTCFRAFPEVFRSYNRENEKTPKKVRRQRSPKPATDQLSEGAEAKADSHKAQHKGPTSEHTPGTWCYIASWNLSKNKYLCWQQNPFLQR